MSEIASQWLLDPTVEHLNHGSFGACPRAVLDHQRALRDELETNPVRFLTDGFEVRLDEAKHALATFVGAEAADLAFVSNATTGVNAVLRSLSLEPGDDLLVTDHAYNACRNALDWVAHRAGANVVVAEIPFPLASARAVIESLKAAVTPRTRLALIDHITSSTALVLPMAEIVDALHERGVDVLVDGAHAPGMIDLDIDRLGAAYYTGNCHKWMCAPKGVGFLHVRRDRQHLIAPSVLSHGENSSRVDRSRFQLRFDWPGTTDPTAALSVKTAIETMASLAPWPEIRQRNRALCLEGRDLLCDALGIEAPAPEDMIGSIASVSLGDGGEQTPSGQSPLCIELREQHQIEVPVFHFPWPRQLIRISAQLYNNRGQYERLARVLAEVCRP